MLVQAAQRLGVDLVGVKLRSSSASSSAVSLRCSATIRSGRDGQDRVAVRPSRRLIAMSPAAVVNETRVMPGPPETERRIGMPSRRLSHAAMRSAVGFPASASTSRACSAGCGWSSVGEQRPPRRGAGPAEVGVAGLVGARQGGQHLLRHIRGCRVRHPPLGERAQRVHQLGRSCRYRKHVHECGRGRNGSFTTKTGAATNANVEDGYTKPCIRRMTSAAIRLRPSST